MEDLAQQIRAQKVSPVEVVDYFLERIEQFNPRLNAFITVPIEHATRAARKAEAEVMKGSDLPPLHGVPVAVKDTLFTKDIRTTGGSLVYKDFVPNYDSAAVERLIRAGAIILGKTNCPEFGMGGGLSYNRITNDDSHNPWNLDHSAAASSAGSAVAVAAGLAPMAIGSDAGGSIRLPAAWCSVYGLKQTTGLVSGYGGFCSNESLPLFTAIGPITRSVRDAAIMLKVMAGYDRRDAFSLRSEPPDFVASLEQKMGNLTIAWSPDLGHSMVDGEIRGIAESGARMFESLGCKVEEATPAIDYQTWYFGVYLTIAAADLYAGHREVLERHPQDLTPILRSVLEEGARIAGSQYARALWDLYRIRDQMEEFFEQYDLLLTPVTPVRPFNILEVLSDYDKLGKHHDDLASFTPIANLIGGPSASVPCGFTSDGLPVGLLINGRPGEDVMVLRASAAFEGILPWANRVPPLA